MEIRIAGIVNDSITDGPGFRLTVFTQGCPHNCEGCHNPQTHDFSAGTVTDTDDIMAKVKKNPLLDGITLSGGEPFCQSAPCAELARQAHKLGLTVMTYTGYLYEQLASSEDEAVKALLKETDILVDGPFILAKRKLSLMFRGSENQRIIDIKKTTETGSVVEYKF